MNKTGDRDPRSKWRRSPLHEVEFVLLLCKLLSVPGLLFLFGLLVHGLLLASSPSSFFMAFFCQYAAARCEPVKSAQEYDTN
jgi:hypothetical protein